VAVPRSCRYLFARESAAYGLAKSHKTLAGVQKEADYGPDGVFYKLKDSCFELKVSDGVKAINTYATKCAYVCRSINTRTRCARSKMHNKIARPSGAFTVCFLKRRWIIYLDILTFANAAHSLAGAKTATKQRTTPCCLPTGSHAGMVRQYDLHLQQN
jgi:hypothetical protein